MVTHDWLKLVTLSTLGLTVTGSLSLLSVWSMLRTFKAGITHLKRLHQVPCYRCQYFTGDYRLKCPVQPLTACTDGAIGCRDFAVISHSTALQRRSSPSKISRLKALKSEQHKESNHSKDHFSVG